MTIVCTTLMILLLLFSDAAMQSALSAAKCFVGGVMPALLPMMVLGKMLPEKEGGGKSLVWVRAGLFACAAGSPAAAQRAVSVRSHLSAKGWECLLCLTGVMSPMFFTGTLAGWLHSARDGWMLLLCHWLGAAVTAGLWALFAKPQAMPEGHEPPTARPLRLPEAISQSAQSMLCILGAMMVFSVAAGLLRSLLAVLFPNWTQSHADGLAVAWAVLEVGGGSSAVIAAYEKPHALLAALCGFGGLSIWMQNLLFLSGSIRPGRLLQMRAIHGAVSWGLVQFFLKIQNLLMT